MVEKIKEDSFDYYCSLSFSALYYSDIDSKPVIVTALPSP